MKWNITKNSKPVKLKDIPVLDMGSFRSQVIRHARIGQRPVAFFGMDHEKKILLFIVMADDDSSRLYISAAEAPEKSYPSIAAEIPSLWNFENEIRENFGIIPEGHPWPKPVRYAFDRASKTETIEKFPFFSMKGEEMHEVAVGPIHAGVIEPGHFRFMCHSEDIHHLEIQLGYQHRGIEKLFLKGVSPVHLAESIAGDSVIAHASACAQAIEALSGTGIPRRAQSIRAIALELERAGIHIGDLSSIANDVAYLLGNSVFQALRTLVINSLLAICGSRFGRGLIRPGGVTFDIGDELKEELTDTLLKVQAEASRMCEEMFSSASVLSRLEETGVVDSKTAAATGMVGLPARASNISCDVRCDHPFGLYKYYPVHKITMDTGDVFARAYLRFVEMNQSINFIIELLNEISDDRRLMVPLDKTAPDSLVVSMTESWRGEVAHAAITDRHGRFAHYKIKDPSFHNWFGLAQAVRGNGISDFPLCNKSFNLSYAGYDL